jgi:hypothetical protein
MSMRKTLTALLLIALASNSTAALSHSIDADDALSLRGTASEANAVIRSQRPNSQISNAQIPNSQIPVPRALDKTGGTTMSNPTKATIAKAPLVEKYLLEGKLADGRKALEEQLKKDPSDDQARFGLGVLVFLDTVERLKQSLFHFGLRNHSALSSALPFARLQVAVNPQPAKISYQDARKLIDDFRKGLLETDHHLALIKSEDVKLPLHFGMIKLNFKDENHPGGGESLWSVYSRLTSSDIDEDTAKAFYIKFDRGDVHWLRGYCHLLSAVCDVCLAYDTKVLFEHTAHIFFDRVDSPYKFLAAGKKVYSMRGSDDLDIMDAVAFIHLLNLKISEPKRMHAALEHLEMVVSQSRESWKFIMAETGDDHEWLPNPRQTGVLPGIRVTDEMVLSWAKIMDQSEKLLKGEELIPFWRGERGTGVNLRKVFVEPRDFDLVLWVQGTEVMPYLETGTLSDGDIWRQAQRTFGNNFPGFALWFN